MKQTEPDLRTIVRDFFLAEASPYGMAMMRICLPLVAAVPLFLRAPRVRELFSTDGAPSQLSAVNGMGEWLPTFPPALTVPLYGILLACLVMAVIGFRTRWSLAVATPLYVYFNLMDTVSTLTKYSVIASHLLLLLTVSNCGALWSVDAWLRQRRETTTVPPRFPIWPARLVQLLFASIYFGAAITKLQTQGFFNGAQLRYWMLSNWNYNNPIGEMMAMWTPVLLIGAYVTLLWELAFGLLFWQPRLRIPVLVLGIGFHVMTTVMLGLYIFPAICLAGYFAFVTEKDVVFLRRWLRRLRLQPVAGIPRQVFHTVLTAAPRQIPAGVTWLCLVGVCAIGLAEVEIYRDLYGTRRNSAGLPLKKMEAAVAREMLGPERRVREKDKFFDFNLGTFMIGQQLANRESNFTYGDVILAQCILNPPHEDLWVECLLQDDQQRTIEQFGQFVARKDMTADFWYAVGNRLLPGQYSLVLKSANQEISRRKFEVSGTPPSSDAAFLTN